MRSPSRLRLGRRDFLRLSGLGALAALAGLIAGRLGPPSASAERPSSPPADASRPSATAAPPSQPSPAPVAASSTGRLTAAPASPQSTASAASSPSPSPSPALAGPRVLYRGAAIADGRSARRQISMSVLVAGGLIAWIRPSDAEEDPGPAAGLTIVDARGATIVPGLVDAHSHVVLPGGPSYIAHLTDSPAKLAATAEINGRRLFAAGVRWVRDVGSPVGVDPHDRRRRGLALGVRDRWEGRTDRPKVRAAGTWVAGPGIPYMRVGKVVSDPARLPAAAVGQLHQGADLVKLYIQAPGGGSPWTVAQIGAAVRAVHAAGGRVAAHATDLRAARAAVAGGVDAVEHGFRLDAALVRGMARRGTVLVTTLSVPKTWIAFGKASPAGQYGGAQLARSERLLRDALESARIAHRAGVAIAAGTDFGGGGPRAGVLAGEVELLVRAGLEPWQALGAATWRGGALLGEPDAGVIREGGPADFILVDGDPLSHPGALWKVRGAR